MSAIIRREVFAACAEGYADPSGPYVIALNEPAVLTDARRIPCPEPLRFPVMTVGTGRGRCIAGQSQASLATWEYVEAEDQWFDRGPNSGERPTLYLPDGTLVIERGGPDHPTEGWAGTSLDGQPVRIVRADHARDLYEVTEIGPFSVGQLPDGGIGLLFDGKRYLVEPGDVHTIWLVLGANGVLAIATRKLAQNETVLLWVDANRIAELPAAPTAPPVIVVPPIIVIPPGGSMQFPFEEGFDAKAAIEAVRAGFPTPLGDRHAEFLVKAARAVGHGAGLLKKDGGTNILLPNGVRVSQDWMVFPNGTGADFLGDGEGAATVGWGEAQANPGTLVPVDGLFVDGPGDPGDPPVDDDLAAQVKALVEQFSAFGGRMAAAERVADANSAQLKVSAQREADFETRIKALEKPGTGAGGGTVPADLAKQIAAEFFKLLSKLGQAA